MRILGEFAGPLVFLAAIAAGVGAAPLRQNDIIFARRPQGDLRLDACRAEGSGPHPVAILVHGGGWAAGNKDGDPSVFFTALTNAGFVWFSLDYRLSPQAPYPACLEDVETGIDWVCLHV